MKKAYLFIILSVFLSSCYSFKGISIPETMHTYDVPFVEVITADAPPSINNDFQDKLIQKINRESRLTFDGKNPDIRINASISEFSVDPVGANKENAPDANRLKISVKVEYEDTKDEEGSWKKSFSQNREFPSGTSLLSVQEDLIDQIFDDIVEDIFNKAFTNW